MQGRVTFPSCNVRGVCTPNTSSSLQSLGPEYSMSIIHSLFPLRALHSRRKNHRRLLVHQWQTFLMLLDLAQARHLQFLSMKPFHLFLRVLHTFRRLPSIFILRVSLPFYKIPKLFYLFVPASNLPSVRNNFAFDDSFDFPF